MADDDDDEYTDEDYFGVDYDDDEYVYEDMGEEEDVEDEDEEDEEDGDNGDASLLRSIVEKSATVGSGNAKLGQNQRV